VYYFVIGQLFGLTRRVENFSVFVFSGLCCVSFYNTAVAGMSRSIVRNRSLIKKVYLPRELFPLAALAVALTRLVPLLVILLIGSTLIGWQLSWSGVGAAVLGFVILLLLALAVGLLLSALYVFLREIQHLLEITAFLAHWMVPMIHPWFLAEERLNNAGTAGHWVFIVYLWNPLCTAVELFHQAYWLPTTDYTGSLSPHLWERGAFSVAFCIVLLAIAQFVFQRLRDRFPEEL
jgi:ABC-2 type transport system permease protein